MADQREQCSNPDEDEVVDVLYDVTSRRSTVPNRVANVEAEILQQRQDLAENVKVLPGLDIKKVATKYPLKKTVPAVKESSDKRDQDMMARTKLLCETADALKSALAQAKREKENKEKN
ncbi:uncharacterized protein LOC128998884 [Macrosteles quadrilineatus]|uniref:uncharacterized protein LOC128998739 n=1 Tax=Macrosteles quadrilineatus TaxID=74068 RepID=UPI0023E1ADCD|nr:uncharacterized protein LOC128998739 [Macrosteles quadrilineatus]XP_054281044.1 uncharacterized protein LOC128998739 [Macrosteles quadrilineatus]XP_054281045.1 uncharacterized protein LOC128998739 [Macrosteles quadrilineatus]XP_054281214.1 uncharacterized protein LOC128998884 [Macrosteles quadrilineatus]